MEKMTIKRILRGIRSRLKTLYHRVVFFTYKQKYVANNLSIYFECSNGDDVYGEPFYLYQQMANDERFGSYTFFFGCNPEAARKFSFLKKNDQTRVVKKTKEGFQRTLARCKYWITDTVLPPHIFPGKEQEWTYLCVNPPKGQYRQLARRVRNIVCFSPDFSESIKRSTAIKDALDRINHYEISPPSALYLTNLDSADIVRIKMMNSIPLQKKIVLFMCDDCSVDIKDGMSSWEAAARLQRRLGDAYQVISTMPRPADTQGGLSLSVWTSVMSASRASKLDELFSLSDILVTSQVDMLYRYGGLGKDMVFYSKSPRSSIKKYGLALPLEDLACFTTRRIPAIAKHIRDGSIEEKKTTLSFHDKHLYKDSDIDIFIQQIIDIDLQYTARQLKRKKRASAKRHLYRKIGGFFRRNGLLLSANSKKLAAYKNRYKGQRCFLVGNGPSLTASDLTLIKNEITFGCNRIYESFSMTSWRPSFLFSVDTCFASDFNRYKENKLTMPLFLSGAIYKALKKKPGNAMYIDFIYEDEYKVTGNPLSYLYSSNATVMATMIETAMYMGFEEIYLIGVDCSNTLQSGQGHFIDNYYTKESKRNLEKKGMRREIGQKMTLHDLGNYYVDNAMVAYHALGEWAKAHHVRIYNATRGGYLEVFERVNLNEAVAGKTKGGSENERISSSPCNPVKKMLEEYRLRQSFYAAFRDLEKEVKESNLKPGSILVLGYLIVKKKKTLVSFFRQIQKELQGENIVLFDEANREAELPFPRFFAQRGILAQEDVVINLPMNHKVRRLLREKKYLRDAVENMKSRKKTWGHGQPEVLAFKLYKTYSLILDTLKPSYVVIWNSFYARHAIMEEICKERGIKTLYLEYGCIPGTYALEKMGQMGESFPAQRYAEFQALPVQPPMLRRAKNVLSYLYAERANRYVQPKNDSVNLLKAKIRANRPVILFAGQNDFDSGIVPYTETARTYHSPVFRSSMEALKALAEISEKNDWNIIYKPHPGIMRMIAKNEQDMFSVPENVVTIYNADIVDVFDLCDMTITLMSQTAYLSLFRKKATLTLGYNQLRGKGCTYEAFDKASIETAIQSALQNGYTTAQHNAFVKHLAQLLSYYLFDDLSERALRYGLHPSKAAALFSETEVG